MVTCKEEINMLRVVASFVNRQDTEAPRSVVDEIKNLSDISNVSQVQLLEMPDKVFRISQTAPQYVEGDTRPSIKPENPQFSSGECGYGMDI